MDWSKVSKILRRACHRDDDVLSRRDALAGIGLAGVFLVAGPKLLAPAEAKPLMRLPSPLRPFRPMRPELKPPSPARRNAMRPIRPTSRISRRGIVGAGAIGAADTGAVAIGVADTGAAVIGVVGTGVVGTGAVATGIETID